VVLLRDDDHFPLAVHQDSFYLRPIDLLQYLSLYSLFYIPVSKLIANPKGYPTVLIENV
jgi:hypothetical protein